jgi:hypothetical protein
MRVRTAFIAFVAVSSVWGLAALPAHRAASLELACADTLDDDGDLRVDCADLDCHGIVGCETGCEVSCADVFDNDGDALVDGGDPDCVGGCADGDADGIPDVIDKCSGDSRNVIAPATCDTDQDGFGNVCDADYDQSLTVAPPDFVGFFIPSFKAGAPGPTGTDMDCNGIVNVIDFTMFFVPRFKAGFVGPSGLYCAGAIPCCVGPPPC